MVCAKNVGVCLVAFIVVPLVLSYGPYGNLKIRGVNLGGWLVLEKWIVPHVFKDLPDNIDDEYKLTQYLGHLEAEKRLRAHWDSWVTEADIILMKNAGINHVRIPIGYWALDIQNNEPWVWGSWDYAVKAVGWCRTHKLKVMLDLHGVPGSQNGNDHSGKSGPIEFFYSDDNLNRATSVIRRIAQWANAAEWRDTVSIIQLLNEPVLWGNDYHYRLDRLKQYYRMAYDAARSVNDIAVIAVHDAFIDPSNWYYLREDPHYWWVMLDIHLYQVWGDEYQKLSCEQHAKIPCRYRDRLSSANQKMWTVVGEWSLATPVQHVKCNNQRDFARQQIGVWESSSSGYFFWAHKNGQKWGEWSFEQSLANGWIRPNASNQAQC